LQERKQALVRDALREAAGRLSAARGFEAVTVGEIAALAGVSRRTFFRYYSSKEDVLLDGVDRLTDELLEAIARRPKRESPLVAVQRAMSLVVEGYAREPVLVSNVIVLMRDSTTLRRALLDRHSQLEGRLARLLAARLGISPKKDCTPALVASITRAVLDTVFNVWLDQGARSLVATVEDVFSKLRKLARRV
jgi:AcrR family transcriptional regulator